MQKYHLGIKGSVIGEKSLEELNEGLSNGTISPDDKVWSSGWADWQNVGEFISTHQEQNRSRKETWFVKPNLRSFWTTLTEILLKPSEAFDGLARPAQLKSSILFWLISAVISSMMLGLFYGGILLVQGKEAVSRLHAGTLEGPGIILIAFVGYMLFTLLSSLVMCTVTHAMVWTFGRRNGWKTTFATLLPCQGAAHLLGAVPFIGILLSIWPFISGLLALAVTQNISIVKSVILQLLAPLFLGLFFLFTLFLIIAFTAM